MVLVVREEEREWQVSERDPEWADLSLKGISVLRTVRELLALSRGEIVPGSQGAPGY